MDKFGDRIRVSYKGRKNAICVVVDRWHCVVDMRDSPSNDEVFREVKRQLAEFRRIQKSTALLMQNFGGSGRGSHGEKNSY